MEKYHRLNTHLGESLKRITDERNSFAATTKDYAKRAGARGDDPTDLGKLVKQVEKSITKDDPPVVDLWTVVD